MSLSDETAPTRPAEAPLLGRTVRFQIRDAFMPPPEELLTELFGAVFVEGEVVDESRGPEESQARDHVVVQLEALRRMVVVKRACVQLVNG
jgi:hypothetical protein